jgi:hypothetical protein
MKIQLMALGAAAIFASFASRAATDPALMLRDSFVQQYARAAVSHGEPRKLAEDEGGCIFDGLSQYMTVAQWIDEVKAAQAGHPQTPPDAPSAVDESIKACMNSVNSHDSAP